MRKILTLLVTLFALGLAAGDALAHTVTLTWTWPTARTDSTALPLASIGGAQVYDTSVPAPGVPGTPVTCAVTIPPTTATATCTTPTLTAGTHGFVVVVTDNASPPDASAVSNAVSVTIAPSGPNAVTDLKAAVN